MEYVRDLHSDLSSAMARHSGQSSDRGHTRSLYLCPRIDPAGFMRIKMNIALAKGHSLYPVRLVLEDSSIRSFLLFVDVSLQLGSIIE